MEGLIFGILRYFNIYFLGKLVIGTRRELKFSLGPFVACGKFINNVCMKEFDR